MSHTGEIKNCSQAVTGVSGARNIYTSVSLFRPVRVLASYVSSALCLSFLPVCSLTRLCWCQTSWPSTTAGELGGLRCSISAGVRGGQFIMSLTTATLCVQACGRPSALRIGISHLGGLLEASKQRGKQTSLEMFSRSLWRQNAEVLPLFSWLSLCRPSMFTLSLCLLLSFCLFQGNMSRGNSLFFRKLPAGKMYAIDQKRFF